MTRTVAIVFAALGALSAAGAAVSGVTTTYSARTPPWYRGEPAPASARLAYSPLEVAAQPAGTPDNWIPRAALEALAADITARLASREDLQRFAAALPGDGRPSVQVGCATTPDGLEDCDDEQRDTWLLVTQSSKKWRAAVAGPLAAAKADHLLIIVLAVRDHWLRQKDLAGRKEVPLGEGYAQPAPWLTSLDTPVSVLQLEGVLVGPGGKVVRGGVEGIFATRTKFMESAIRLQRVITDEDVARVRTELRRTDLPGSPLAWEAALDALVRGLTGR